MPAPSRYRAPAASRTTLLGNAQLTIDSGQTLTLDGTTVTGGNITDSGTVHVDAAKTLTLSGVALSGGAITNAGTIEIPAPAASRTTRSATPN